MPGRKRVAKKVLVGAGFLSSIGKALGRVVKVVKRTGAVGQLLPGRAGAVARIAGFGKKKRGHKPKVGGASQMYRL